MKKLPYFAFISRPIQVFISATFPLDPCCRYDFLHLLERYYRIFCLRLITFLLQNQSLWHQTLILLLVYQLRNFLLLFFHQFLQISLSYAAILNCHHFVFLLNRRFPDTFWYFLQNLCLSCWCEHRWWHWRTLQLIQNCIYRWVVLAWLIRWNFAFLWSQFIVLFPLSWKIAVLYAWHCQFFMSGTGLSHLGWAESVLKGWFVFSTFSFLVFWRIWR